LVLDGRRESFTIRGILPEFRDRVPLPANLAIADLGALLQRVDRATLDRIEIIVPDGPARESIVKAVGTTLQETTGSRWSLTSPAEREVDGASMTAAFRLNLTVLSLIALLVGLYLIAQTLDATVSRRRTEIASLRSLGLAPRDIQRLWLSEAVLYGIAAAVVGLLIGYAMATITVEAVTTTVRALYRDTVQTASTLRFSDVLLAFALGMGGSLVAAWLPARDAASTPPAQFLRLGKRIPPFPVFQHPWIGLAAITLGVLFLFLPPWQPRPGTTIPVMGYATAFLWLTGGTLATVGSLRWLGLILYRTAPDNAPARLAASRLKQPTSRHQLALSGFFVAIGMAASMAFLINSFQHTVTAWLEQRLQADLFLSSAGFQGADSGQRMPGAILDRIETDPDILELDRYRSVEVNLNGSSTTLGGSRFDLLGDRQKLLWLNGPLDPASRPPGTDAVAYANENLIRRAGLSAGETVHLVTPAGPVALWIGGVHADYARDNGSLLVDLAQLEAWYQLSEYDTAGAFLSEEADPATVQARLREAHPGLAIRRNGELMEAALFIFNQTFAVTRALQLIGLVVALTGLALSLLSLLRESGRELSLQRTLGMSRREIALTTALEGSGIALAGLLSGILLSLGLGLVLIYVINRQSFGWTLQLAFPWTDIALLGAGVLGL
ncbi:MAG TPA: FtsX-like permease family protein, partial [Oceanipulchritudo sp.]|nr:FtsX-like permease family protein [Oceanipulchritudo sp.]